MSVGAAWGPAVKSVEMRKVTLWVKEFTWPYEDVRSTQETEVLKVQFISSQSRCQLLHASAFL